ncbi:PEP-CTERM sorting domain-containing protein [Roseateles sp. P5_E1]
MLRLLAAFLALTVSIPASATLVSIDITGHFSSTSQIWDRKPADNDSFDFNLLVNTETPGTSLSDFGGTRYLVGGNQAVDAAGIPRSPSAGLFMLSAVSAGTGWLLFPHDETETLITQEHDETFVTAIAFRAKFDTPFANRRLTGSFFLRIPVTYKLPIGLNLANEGTYTVGNVAIGESSFTFYDDSELEESVTLIPETFKISASMVPEPASFGLLAVGTLLLIFMFSRRASKRSRAV